ncbi:hypothetical protein K474DRAFT_301037 [Panus rudis PR-1116 ss-1]|nr:hypothetical protein K474DRAFT_301037 [Panus rudis PR-1116 ss-1]
MSGATAAPPQPSALPPSNGQHPPWPSHATAAPPQYPPPQLHTLPSSSAVQRPNKRKLDDSDGDPHSKIRRVVHDHTIQESAKPMTTVLCLHAAVAQKSYGSEKRFLCPPPIVHIEGPVWQMKKQQLSMAVVNEGGERSFEQRAPLDNNLTASFKFLHVSGTAKAKSFQLTLDIAEPASTATEGSENVTPGRVWASFDSAPVTIISKPSKKTAKTRNLSSCILAGGPVSLFNRINSQTVRTKYMTVDRTQLCASNVTWSAFNVTVVNSEGQLPTPSQTPSPVTYGSFIILSETMSGTQTAPLVIRKVDKGRIVPDDGGPVSQMQKIALQRVNPDGTRHYLSAAGPPMPTAAGTMAANATGAAGHQSGTHPLLFQAPRVRDEVKDGVRVITDEVDDFLCWTIVGISKFQYTFFDAFGKINTIPDMPITPFPTLFTAPVANGRRLDLSVANFFYEDPKTRSAKPLDVYLGSLGPLPITHYSDPRPGLITTITPSPMHLDVHTVHTALPDLGHLVAPAMGGSMHVSVSVELPPIIDILRAMSEAATTPTEDSADKQPSPYDENWKPDYMALRGRTLPLLFIRSHDGVGYHSGRAITLYHPLQSGTYELSGMEPMSHGWVPQVV